MDDICCRKLSSELVESPNVNGFVLLMSISDHLLLAHLSTRRLGSRLSGRVGRKQHQISSRHLGSL